MMILRRNFFLLLFVSLASFLLVYYFDNNERETAVSRGRVMGRPLETIQSKEKEETPFLYPPESLFKLYDGVETFVMFIGYPRSSHSLVGAILDAHPEIIITHEYSLLQQWEQYRSPELKKQNLQKYALFYHLHQRSIKQARFGIRAPPGKAWVHGEFDYNYNVQGLWQGKYDKKIKVIGDKKGGATSSFLVDPSRMNILEEINQVVQVPMKFIHITRNPFDNIATMMLGMLGARDDVREAGAKINATGKMGRYITRYFNLAASNQRIREQYGNAVIDIPGHETVLRPEQTLQRLCDHLDVTCSEDYFEKCGKLMYGTPSVTRDKVVWSDAQIQRVTEMMKSYPFLEDYSYDRYPF